MSELMNMSVGRKNFRRRFLTTVSVLALLGSVYGASEAKAVDDDGDHPTVWIELGGQLSRLNDAQEAFSPSVMAARPSIFAPSQKFERMPIYSIDENGKVSFQPDGSDWAFSASVRYGHSVSDKHVRQQTNRKPFVTYLSGHRYAKYGSAKKFADTKTQNGEHHFVLDFQAGKDVGLGVFGGGDGSSILGLGVRFAQFGNKSNIALKSDPDWHFYYKSLAGRNLPLGSIYHSNAATINTSRSFRGLGPSISWNASAPFAGNSKDGEIAFDWGLNAAILFGRQKAVTNHSTMAGYHGPKYRQGPGYQAILYNHTTSHERSRFVTVPNAGGFAGLSFRYTNAKLSFGYRADFFFAAMDGGIDTRKVKNVGFHGPFATVSIGLGG